MDDFVLKVNGAEHRASRFGKTKLFLVPVLRNQLHLTVLHKVRLRGRTNAGACTVLIDGAAITRSWP